VERNAPTPVQSASRALALVKLLLEEGSVGTTEAALALGVNPSTAYRLLATLVVQGFAVQGADKRYRIGPALPLGYGTLSQPSPAALLRPFIERLFERVGETVHLAALAGTQIQHLDGIEATAHALRFGLRVGVWLPAHRTSAGKALLAELPDDEIDARYQMALAGPRGRHIDVDLVALHEQLDEVRDTRIGWNFEESEPGIAALAIAIGDLDGQHAAFSISVPIVRFTREKGQRWAAELVRIVDDIHAEL